jgi:hypothetical protein
MYHTDRRAFRTDREKQVRDDAKAEDHLQHLTVSGTQGPALSCGRPIQQERKGIMSP